ncbi:MAG: PD-(D/E)XK nuclease family protein [Bdellovibrionales bacterium]|nr:PD-(D/E)XK nuclease family protein [Bdellovibrionales bacterium]
MIQIQEFSHPNEKWKRFDGRDRAHSIWIVGDRENQVACETRELKQNGAILGMQILRFTDWMQDLFKTNFPDIAIVSRLFFVEFIREICARSQQAHLKLPSSAEKIHDLIQFLAPQLTSPESLERVRQWFFENPEAFERWGHWWISSAEILNEALGRKVIANGMIPGFLMGRIDDVRFSKKDCYFDLGTFLKPGEVELLESLGKSNDVTIFVSRTLSVSQSHPGYERLKAIGQLRPSTLPAAAVSLEKKRFSTMLSEVKDAVAWARRQLESGVAAESLVIAAPDIGLYWPVLLSYFKVEGIPVDRAQKAVNLANPKIQGWLSRWRMVFLGGTFGDAETLSISGKSGGLKIPDLRAQMRAHWNPRIAELLAGRLGLLEPSLKTGRFGIFEIISLMEPTLEDAEGSESLQRVLIQLGATCPDSIKLPPSSWLKLIEDALSRSESLVEVDDLKGIRVTDLVSLQSVRGQCLYLLGLDQDSLKPQQSEVVRDQDAKSLFEFCGYHANHHLAAPNSILVECLEKEGPASQTWSFPETNFNGDPLTPSLVWLSKNSDPHHRQLPALTRWDEIQRSPLLESTTPSIAFSLQRWKEDLGLQQLPPFAKDVLNHVSASGLQDYKKCPMIFAAKRVFGLSDKNDLDTEVDPLSKGSLIHAFLGQIIQEPFRSDWSDEELVQEIRKTEAVLDWNLLEPGVYKKFEADTLKLARNVIAFEAEVRRSTPIKTRGHELSFNLWIDLDQNQLLAAQPQKGMRVRGAIDRVDILANQAILVLDYKTGAAARQNYWKAWERNNAFQLPIYLLATKVDSELNQGLEIAGAMYYGLNPIKTQKGIIDQKFVSLMEGRGKMNQAQIPAEEFPEFLRTWENKVIALGHQVRDGVFPPVPEKPTHCEGCRWRSQCRAPHLR